MKGDRPMMNNVASFEELSMEELIQQAECDLITAPHYLQESVMEKSQSIQVQLPMQLEIHAKLIPQKMQMFYYTMKVSLAMVCTLILLAVSAYIPSGLQNGLAAIKEPVSTKTTLFTTTISEQKSDFTETISHLKKNITQTINGGNKHE
jgi:hypothetical protein